MIEGAATGAGQAPRGRGRGLEEVPEEIKEMERKAAICRHPVSRKVLRKRARAARR